MCNSVGKNQFVPQNGQKQQKLWLRTSETPKKGLKTPIWRRTPGSGPRFSENDKGPPLPFLRDFGHF